MPDSKANLVYSRLSKRLRDIGLRSFHEYCRLIERADQADERQLLIAAMTTNVTRFFREPHHFEHLERQVLPGLIAAARKGQKVRLWSAGCSSGEEPYSIAMTLLKAMPDAASHDILILASDIDHTMVAQARAATYPKARLADLPADCRRHLEPDAHDKDRCVISAQARALVRFRRLNLLKPWPLKAIYHVIFCRNVMIYFDQPTQDGIWARFSERLAPGATLYIGHSERIATETLPFVLAGQTIYQRERAP
jgi:chemotaxis protein methyltransferase CheR